MSAKCYNGQKILFFRIGRIGFPFLFQKIGVFLSERFDRGELFDSQFVKMILRCLVQ